MLKLSVCVITYNQEKYIGQCLQSILDQETNFDFEVVVGEDCSTDSTRSIVQDFKKRYPSIIKPIYQTKNIGAGVNNFITTHRAAKGQYIAHVDGDDYCLPGKLQAQVDILDAEPLCNLVFHRLLILKPNGEFRAAPTYVGLNLSTAKLYRSDFLQNTLMGWQSSKMYRREFGNFSLPEDFEITDFYSTIEQIGNGYARFTGDHMYGVYRLQVGITTNSERLSKALVKTFKHFSIKYPSNRPQINTAVLAYLIADVKNLRRTSFRYFRCWISTFHYSSVFRLLANLKFTKSLIVKD